MEQRLIPVRCWTCHRPLQGLWERYLVELAQLRPAELVLDELGTRGRVCCRRMLTSQPVPLPPLKTGTTSCPSDRSSPDPGTPPPSQPSKRRRA